MIFEIGFGDLETNSMKREHYVTTAGFLDHIREALIKKFTNGQNNKL